eukprot:g4270.t1
MLTRLRSRVEQMSNLRTVFQRSSSTTSVRSRSTKQLGLGYPLRTHPTIRTYAVQLVNGVTEGEIKERVEEKDIVTETEESYLAYAMSVIMGRSLPDVRDGLKPVHRRILYGMHELGMTADKPHKKCARVVGEVLGKFHPHGDMAVYDAMVRMAQDFMMRYTLVDGHGNFGSIDHDPPAAMRYTECKLRALSSEMMLDHLDQNTVDFIDTFDAAEKEPLVLPAKVPQLLINGCHGIAVGMATHIPPHNMTEVVQGMKALIKNPEISINDLMTYIPAPDFPTGGKILHSKGLEAAYLTGHGKVIMRGIAEIENGQRQGTKKAQKDAIVITELPYSVNKAKFVEHIVKLVENQTIQGIADVLDESDRDGLRVVVEVKKGAVSEIVLNNLYKHTDLQKSFPCNMTVIVDGRPQQLNLKQMLEHFLKFRVDVVKRRSQFRLEKALNRLKLVEALLKALQNVEDVVKILKQSPSITDARTKLCEQFEIDTEQASAISSMALSRLTITEVEKLTKEKIQLNKDISHLESVLSSPNRVMKEVESEASQIVRKFGDERRSRLIMDDTGELRDIDIIPNDPTIITFSRKGYIKRVDPDAFSVQNRGGVGVYGAKMRGDDTMIEILQVRAHDKVLFFCSNGRVYCLRAYQIPCNSRKAAGNPIGNVLPGLSPTTVTAIFTLNEATSLTEKYLLMATKQGKVKRTPLSQFSKIRATGLLATRLKEDDELRFVQVVSQDASVLIASSNGRVIRFNVGKVRPMGRVASGVRGIALPKDAQVVGMLVLPPGEESDEPDEEVVEDVEIEGDGLLQTDVPAPTIKSLEVLMVTKNGLGKRTDVRDFPTKVNRNGIGYIGIRLRKKDELVNLKLLSPNSAPELVLASKQGMMTRIRGDSIRKVSRLTYGVKVMNVKEEDAITSVTTVTEEDV